VAFAVDDLNVLACNLILLTLALIQKVEGVHLLLHGRFFEKLGLQIEQRQAIELRQKGGRDQRQAHALILQGGHQCKKLEDEHAAQQCRAQQLARADAVKPLVRHQAGDGVTHQNANSKGKADLPQQHRHTGQRGLLQTGPGRHPDQQTPQLINRL